jgi:hypothetical protein
MQLAIYLIGALFTPSDPVDKRNAEVAAAQDFYVWGEADDGSHRHPLPRTKMPSGLWPSWPGKTTPTVISLPRRGEN